MGLSMVILFLSGIIAVGIARKKNMWILIALYWTAVYLKNLFDVKGVS